MPTKQQIDGERTIPVLNIPMRRVEVPVPVPSLTTQTVAYGSLAGLAMLGVVEWPIALLLGLGWAVVTSRPRQE